jgi:hypothetical protein
MKLPLFVSASPAASTSPFVLIGIGSWRFASNQQDSIIELRSKCQKISIPVSHEGEFVVDIPTLFQVIVTSPGKENSLTIFLEKKRDAAKPGPV